MRRLEPEPPASHNDPFDARAKQPIVNRELADAFPLHLNPSPLFPSL